MGRIDRLRANCFIPSPAMGKNAIIAASATPTPTAGQRRSAANAMPTVAEPNTTAHLTMMPR